MGFLIFVTEQSVYIHQYCWREGVNIRLLTKFKGDTPKGWQRYCTTKPQNFIDTCWSPQHRKNSRLWGSYSFPLSRRFTFKLGKFNFKVLFSAKSTDFRQMILIKI